MGRREESSVPVILREAFLRVADVPPQERRKALKGDKACGTDTVETEPIADNVRTQNFAAVILCLMVTLHYCPGRAAARPDRQPSVAHLYIQRVAGERQISAADRVGVLQLSLEEPEPD